MTTLVYHSLIWTEYRIKNYQNPTQRKEAYLDLYAHQHPCPAWSWIARVLNSVNLRQQADLVDTTYVKGTQDTL